MDNTLIIHIGGLRWLIITVSIWVFSGTIHGDGYGLMTTGEIIKTLCDSLHMLRLHASKWVTEDKKHKDMNGTGPPHSDSSTWAFGSSMCVQLSRWRDSPPAWWTTTRPSGVDEKYSQWSAGKQHRLQMGEKSGRAHPSLTWCGGTNGNSNYTMKKSTTWLSSPLAITGKLLSLFLIIGISHPNSMKCVSIYAIKLISVQKNSWVTGMRRLGITFVTMT